MKLIVCKSPMSNDEASWTIWKFTHKLDLRVVAVEVEVCPVGEWTKWSIPWVLLHLQKSL